VSHAFKQLMMLFVKLLTSLIKSNP